MEATVAIAGVGGVGGRVAEVLARSGVGRLRLADPDTFSTSNLNRQAASTLGSIGQNKASAVSGLCRSVSPRIAVEDWPVGIDVSNVDEFIDGADVIVDVTDYTTPSVGLMLARAAAQRSIPVVIGAEIAFGAWHTVFRRTGDFERVLGLPRNVAIEQVDRGEVSVELWRWVHKIPPYVDIDLLRAIEAGEIEAPAIAPAVELSASLLSTDVIQLLLHRSPVAVAPRVHAIDVRTGKSWIGKSSKSRFVISALNARRRSRARTR